MGYCCRTIPFEILQKFWKVLAPFSLVFLGEKNLINGWQKFTHKWKSERSQGRLEIGKTAFAISRLNQRAGWYEPFTKESIIDVLVKSPSAALRCNPAPLDNNPDLGVQG
jgi:hypothetical protein